jgi:hypothetical protein
VQARPVHDEHNRRRRFPARSDATFTVVHVRLYSTSRRMSILTRMHRTWRLKARKQMIRVRLFQAERHDFDRPFCSMNQKALPKTPDKAHLWRCVRSCVCRIVFSSVLSGMSDSQPRFGHDSSTCQSVIRITSTDASTRHIWPEFNLTIRRIREEPADLRQSGPIYSTQVHQSSALSAVES